MCSHQQLYGHHLKASDGNRRLRKSSQGASRPLKEVILYSRSRRLYAILDGRRGAELLRVYMMMCTNTDTGAPTPTAAAVRGARGGALPSASHPLGGGRRARPSPGLAGVSTKSLPLHAGVGGAKCQIKCARLIDLFVQAALELELRDRRRRRSEGAAAPGRPGPWKKRGMKRRHRRADRDRERPPPTPPRVSFCACSSFYHYLRP